jgi:hypothetical protein
MKPNRIDRKRSILRAGVILGAVSLAPVAQAQFEPSVSGKPGEQHLQTRFGVSVQGGGGVSEFMRSQENNLTDIGGNWEVRAVFGTRTIPALEAAYVGSSRSVNAGLVSGSSLVSNGAEGAFRLNAPFLTNEVLIEPFGFVGLGWGHYYLTNLTGQFVSVRSDDVGTIPMGGGLALGYHGFIAEVRFTYRPTWGDTNLVLSDNGRTFDLDTWNVGGMIGFEF